MTWTVMEERELYQTENKTNIVEKNTTPVVDEIDKINFEGNVIPPSWFQNIRRGKKAHLLAINILSDIIYWYRPTYNRNESTGYLVSITKKFKVDMLQRSYDAWADMFGQSKEQCKEACDYLIELGLIKREFRNIIVGIQKLSNVMYVEPIPKNVLEITYRLEKTGYSHHSKNKAKENTPLPGGENDPHLSPKSGGTNTVVTTVVTTDVETEAAKILALSETIEFEDLESATKTDRAIDSEKIAIGKFNDALTYPNLSKRDKDLIRKMVKDDPDLSALDGAISDLRFKNMQFLTAPIILSWWAGRINAKPKYPSRASVEQDGWEKLRAQQKAQYGF